jgi:hypothetical protein
MKKYDESNQRARQVSKDGSATGRDNMTLVEERTKKIPELDGRESKDGSSRTERGVN